MRCGRSMDKLEKAKNATVFIAENVKLGKNVRFYGFNNVYGCEIGDGSRIGTFVEIQNGVVIGKNCKISSHTFICEGVTIEDRCFIGHGVLFINDRVPRATNEDGSLKGPNDWTCEKTLIKRGASIGSGAIIMGGVTIGEGALIGAGAVVTKNIAADQVVAGLPARTLLKGLAR
jgi:UDP-2-acetamido-3-amino-2,3-dideoxy-glucuronate N-acetyltransferase